jgi:uncharacterized protein (DUF1800 family)
MLFLGCGAWSAGARTSLLVAERVTNATRGCFQMMKSAMQLIRYALLLTVLGGSVWCAGGSRETRPADGPPGSPTVIIQPNSWTRQKQAIHVLNRLAYGPAPRDLEAIEQMGIEGWIRWQLHPDRVPDDAVALQLQAFSTLSLSTAQLLASYPSPDAAAKSAAFDAREAKDPAPKEATPKVDLPREIIVELTGAKLVRAVESRRQLQEVLVDFWFNHFNVSAEKGEVRWLLTSYERDAIRPRVFGNFRDLLGATAHHPAMLFYLDNWLSTRDQPDARELAKGRGAPRKRPAGLTGLNENYARELLELHTLGVDGGYTQQDVREVARCFTGWSIEQPKKQGAFVYRDFAHDKGPKVVLGTRIPAGGAMDDGERVLDLLVNHPATARFIAVKLARRFVSDHPPPSLIDRVASVFQQTHGDLPSVYAALFSAPEFWSDEAFASKTKTPLEYVVSAIRVLGGTTNGEMALAFPLERMGEPLYRCQPPTGFAEGGETWINPGALINRINFGLALAANRIHGTTVDVTRYVRRSSGPPVLNDVLDPLARVILQGSLQASTRKTLSDALAETEAERLLDGERRPANPMVVAGLLLGSPEFQKQ